MEIRNQMQLGPFVEEWSYSWFLRFGEEPESWPAKNTIYRFAMYMAELEGLTLQSIARRGPYTQEGSEEQRDFSFIGPDSVSFQIAAYWEAEAALDGPCRNVRDERLDSMISDFVGFMAREKYFLFQHAQTPVDDFL